MKKTPFYSVYYGAENVKNACYDLHSGSGLSYNISWIVLGTGAEKMRP